MRELFTYIAAGVVYVAIGVAYTSFLYSSVVALAFLVCAVWLVPAGLRRLRERRQPS